MADDVGVPEARPVGETVGDVEAEVVVVVVVDVTVRDVEASRAFEGVREPVVESPVVVKGKRCHVDVSEQAIGKRPRMPSQ